VSALAPFPTPGIYTWNIQLPFAQASPHSLLSTLTPPPLFPSPSSLEGRERKDRREGERE
jgi:hypothetical protein